MYSNEQRIQGYVVKCRNDGYILKQYENQFHNAFEQFYSHGEWYKIPVNFDYASFFKSINVKYERFVHRIRPYYGNIKEKKPSYMTHDEWIKEEASNYKLLIERFLQLEKYEKMLDKPERIHNQA